MLAYVLPFYLSPLTSSSSSSYSYKPDNATFCALRSQDMSEYIQLFCRELGDEKQMMLIVDIGI